MAIALGSCSVKPAIKPREIRITVFDKNTSLPVDSASVTLITMVDARDIYPETKYTDGSGHCSFMVTPNPSGEYQVRTEKKGLIPWFDAGYASLIRSVSNINIKTDRNIVLYLTSDSMNHISFWKNRAVRYSADSLVYLLKSDKFPLRSEFPVLLWEDIPGLLSIGNSRTLISKYPISALSSSYSKECYLGIIALWFIESARITELKETWNPSEKFPSLTPALQYSDRPGMSPENSEIIDKVFNAYKNWWEKVKSMDKKEGSKLNPLEKTGLEWR